MKMRKIGFVMFISLMLGFFMMPFTFAISEKIGVDPIDDILQSKSSGLIALEYWLGNFYFDESNPPYAADLFDKHTELFDIVDGPDCIDVIEYGIDNDDIYIIVEDIIDYIDISYFTIGILIFYNNTYDRDFIMWAGEIEIYNGVITDNEYFAIFNEDMDNEDIETGSIGIDILTNKYTLEFDDSWITETDIEVITDNMYGVVFGANMYGSFNGNITQYNLDMIPNGYYGQADDSEDSEDSDIYGASDAILFAVIILVFMIIIFVIIAFFNKNKKQNRKKRTRRKY